MKKRWIADRVLENIASMPATALLGARQTGKTTLAKMIGERKKSIYLDMESPEDLLKLTDAADFLRSHSDKLIILDEIQRAPELFEILRGVIDANRYEGKKSGQFLLLGSASMHLMQQSSESLAGRISYVEMSGFNILETSKKDLHKLHLRGGFPDSYLAENDNSAFDWLENLIRTYLERDVPQMGFRAPARKLRYLWTMLAHLQGETIEYSKLSGSLQVSSKTVSLYIDILTDLLLVRRLQPWHGNVKKRLVKSPRYYIRDSGIAHRLLGIHSRDDLLSHPIVGKSWEGFVIENIHSILPKRAESYFYRTSAGAEIDLVIKMPNSQTWAVEIKFGKTPQLNKHYDQTCKDVGADAKYIIYGGDENFSIGDNVKVTSLSNFMQELATQ